MEVSAPLSTAPVRVLLVDDNAPLLKSFSDILRAHGFIVETASTGKAALQHLDGPPFDVILTDISMPELDGLQLIREIRARDLDVPVVLITGQPAVETAVKAVAYGAHRYLSKPVSPQRLVETIRRGAQVCHIARERRAAAAEFGEESNSATDQAGVEAIFDQAMTALWVAYQPIITAQGELFGFEALLRTDERLFPKPPALIAAAQQLHRLHELTRRAHAQAVATLQTAPADTCLFINLHPQDLLDGNLLDGSNPLLNYSKRIVFEITERAKLSNIPEAKVLINALRETGFRIAVDDLGSGYAGLNTFANIEPDIVKLDLMLVRDVNESRTKQKLIRSVCQLCKDMNVLVVAEGVESHAEETELIALGVDLLQGFRYAAPGRPFPTLSNAPSRHP